MKILILDTYYERFLTRFYSKNPEIQALDYRAHLKRLMALRFGTFDAYSHYFKLNGHEAEEIIINDGQLQAKWAKENGFGVFALPPLMSNGINFLFGRDWRFAVLLKQVQAARPDVLFIHEQSILTDAMVKELKRHVRLTVCQTASPLLARRSYASIDLFLTSFPHFVEIFRAKGINAEYVKLGFDARILKEISMDDPKEILTFVGGVSRYHPERIQMLENVSFLFPLVCYGYTKGVSLSTRLKKCWRDEVWGLTMYQKLRGSRMSLNLHAQAAGECANNMRLYEATGVGTCLVTDWKKNLGGLFDIDREVVAYKNNGELIDKLRYLHEHPQECKKIAEAGQRRTLLDHTYALRIPEIIKIIETKL